MHVQMSISISIAFALNVLYASAAPMPAPSKEDIEYDANGYPKCPISQTTASGGSLRHFENILIESVPAKVAMGKVKAPALTDHKMTICWKEESWETEPDSIQLSQNAHFERLPKVTKDSIIANGFKWTTFSEPQSWAERMNEEVDMFKDFFENGKAVETFYHEYSIKPTIIVVKGAPHRSTFADKKGLAGSFNPDFAHLTAYINGEGRIVSTPPSYHLYLNQVGATVTSDVVGRGWDTVITSQTKIDHAVQNGAKKVGNASSARNGQELFVNKA